MFGIYQQSNLFHFIFFFFFRRLRFEKHQKREKPNLPGENGAAVRLSPEDQKKADSLFRKEAFNIIASDKVALDRSVKDVRDPK